MAEEDRDSQHVNDMLTDTATTSKELIQSIALNIPNALRQMHCYEFISLLKTQWMVAGLAKNSLQVNMAIVNMAK